MRHFYGLFMLGIIFSLFACESEIADMPENRESKVLRFVMALVYAATKDSVCVYEQTFIFGAG